MVYAIGLYFGDEGTSIGVGTCSSLDCKGDHGVYLIGRNWDIVGRKSNYGAEEVNAEKTEDIRSRIVAAARSVKEMSNAPAV